MTSRRQQRWAQNCRRHLCRRAFQRFGLALAVPDIIEAEGRIWSGDADWLVDFHKMRSAYRVRLKDRSVIAIFDIRLEAIVTCLPDSPATKLYGQKVV